MLSFEFYIQFHAEIIHKFLLANYTLLSPAKCWSYVAKMLAIIIFEENAP